MEVHDRVIKTESLLPVECPVLVVWGHRGVILMWVIDREDHLGIRSCAEHTVSQANDGLLRFGVCGLLRDELVAGLEASFYALGMYVSSLCVSVTPLL